MKPGCAINKMRIERQRPAGGEIPAKEYLMKLIYDTAEDRKELELLTRHFLQTRKGEEFTGMSARSLYRSIYGIDIDHHVWISALDYMSRIDEADYLGNNKWIVS